MRLTLSQERKKDHLTAEEGESKSKYHYTMSIYRLFRQPNPLSSILLPQTDW